LEIDDLREGKPTAIMILRERNSTAAILRERNSTAALMLMLTKNKRKKKNTCQDTLNNKKNMPRKTCQEKHAKKNLPGLRCSYCR
jgi:hypothetical protein